MKLLCDVCENAVASLICCADEAALCSSCDSSVHAANKLASKHQRMPLLAERSEPLVCDICQERPSFFFCIEDRALLCRDCDFSIHSANALAGKHRRFLLTRLQVGVGFSGSPSQETSSGISSEQGEAAVPLNSLDVAVQKPGQQAADNAAANNDGGELAESKRALTMQAVRSPTMNHIKQNEGSKEALEKAKKASTPVAMNAKALRSYLMGKKSLLSNIGNTDIRKEVMDSTTSNSKTTISIQRISSGKVPFVAPVLSTLRAALMHEEVSCNVNDQKYANIDGSKGSMGENIDKHSNHSVLMDVDDCPLVESENVSDYLVSGLPGWRFDELLTDLVGVCESGSSLSPPKESNALGFGIHEDPPWYADLDAMEEARLSPSQEAGVALVPEMPSPPTASGLITSCGKPTCPAAQPWAFDYLFTDPHHSNEFSVVPDIDGRRSSPLSTASPTRDSIRKKRKFWLEF